MCAEVCACLMWELVVSVFLGGRGEEVCAYGFLGFWCPLGWQELDWHSKPCRPCASKPFLVHFVSSSFGFWCPSGWQELDWHSNPCHPCASKPFLVHLLWRGVEVELMSTNLVRVYIGFA